MPEQIQPPWRPCRSCKNGRIVLFTSIAKCADCLGTGIDLSHDSLNAPLQVQELSVRTRKLLIRQGVETIRQLLVFVHTGKLSQIGPNHGGTIAEILLVLYQCGLPIGPRQEAY